MWGGNDVFCVEFEFLLILQGNLRFFVMWFCGMDFERGDVGMLDFVGIVGGGKLIAKLSTMFDVMWKIV